MNLAQYRFKAAAQRRNRLLICLGVAGMCHIGAIALIHPPILQRPSSALIPFIAIDQPDSLPASSKIRANSAGSVQTTHPAVSTFTGITRSPSPLSLPQTKTSPQVISSLQTATAKDEVWSEYLTILRQRIYQQWQTTPLVKGDRPTKVRFVIDRQGHLADLELIQSSSDATADQDAMQAVQTAAPFAQLPRASKEDRLRVTFTFEAPVFREQSLTQHR